MKTILLLAALLLLSNSIINAQTPNWAWAQSPGSGGGSSIAADTDGHVYITGFFDTHSINFGSTTLSDAGEGSAFLAKYDASGNVIWATAAGGGSNASTYATGQAVCTDHGGNVFITGYFGNGNLIVAGDTLIFPGSYALYIVKLDSSGNVVWTRAAKSLNTAECLGISADTLGNVYVTGNFSGHNIIFGNDTLTLIGASTATNIFVAKYDASGNVVWAKNAGGNSTGQGITASADGYVYVTGGFLGTGNIIFGNDTLLYTGSEHSFLTKYDTSGNVIWAKAAGGPGSNSGAGVSTDTYGNVYITGGYDSTIIFGRDSLINAFGYDSSISQASYSAFIVKYDASGNVIWAKSSGASTNASVEAISTDGSGNSYLTGLYMSPAITFGTDTLIGDSANTEVFVVKYNSSGSVVWAKSTSGSGTLGSYMGSAIGIDASGNSYLTGYFANPGLSFGDITLPFIYGGPSYENIFIAKLGAVATGIAAVKNTINTINVYPNPSTGNFYFSGVPTGSTVQVYNVLGEMVSSSIAGNSIYQLHLNDAKGIYFYRVMDTGNVIGQGKIVME